MNLLAPLNAIRRYVMTPPEPPYVALRQAERTKTEIMRLGTEDDAEIVQVAKKVRTFPEWLIMVADRQGVPVANIRRRSFTAQRQLATWASKNIPC